MEDWIGIDIGGANLKIANAANAINIPFALWQAPENLAEVLLGRLKPLEPFQNLAVTMTGELADCFESRQAGVRFICNALKMAFQSKELFFYQTNGQFVSHSTAIQDWRLSAASNWHATAALIGEYLSDCIVVDIGSTTTDIVPVRNGAPIAIGKTDFQRLSNHELLYTGVSRTPLYGICRTVKIDQRPVHLAAEYFASMRDVYILLGRSTESTDCNTADGRPTDVASASRRLAKMLCLDVGELTKEQLIEFADQFYQQQLKMVAAEIRAVSNRVRCSQFVILGEGAWLARDAISTIDSAAEIFDTGTFCNRFGLDDSLTIGPAYAVYSLARKHAALTRRFTGQ